MCAPYCLHTEKCAQTNKNYVIWINGYLCERTEILFHHTGTRLYTCICLYVIHCTGYWYERWLIYLLGFYVTSHTNS